jgi:single-strand DNA-binding protein
MYNSIQLIGRLGDDPQSRGNDPENPIVVFNMATSESYVNKNGEKVEDTTWHKVTVYGGLAKYSNYLTKGSLVFVEGSLRKNEYVDANGIKRIDTYVKASSVKNLTPKPSNVENSQPVAHTPSYQQPRNQQVQQSVQQPSAQRTQPVQQPSAQRTQPVQQPSAQRTQPVQQRVVPTVQAPQFTEEDFNFEPQGDELPF